MQRPAFAQSAPIVQYIVNHDLHKHSLVVDSYAWTVMLCPKGVLSCWLPTLLLVNYRDTATGERGTALLKNVHPCRTCFRVFGVRNGPMTAWRLEHYGIDAAATGQLLRRDYARPVHISPTDLPKALRMALTMQHALDTFEQRRWGAKSPDVILDGYATIRERCPHKYCAWTRTVGMGWMHGGDDGGQALFTNNKKCPSCFKVITAGGGYLGEVGAESYGLDRVSAQSLFTGKGHDDSTAP